MGIQYNAQQIQEDVNQPISPQDTISPPLRPPLPPPPQPPPRFPHGKRERWFIVALIVVLVLILAMASVFAVQLSRRPATQPTPAPTVAATAALAPTAAITPTPAPTRAPTPTPAPPAGAYQPINSLWMGDTATGWARTTTHLILHTTDGGKNWQNVTPPYPAGSSTQLPPAFTFLNRSVAWIAISGKQLPDRTAPGVVFRTSDGGHTWQQATLPTSILGVSQVQFVDAQNGWVLSSFGGGAAGSEAVNLFRSTDGGRTWSIIARAPGALPFAGIKSGMGWISATTGWITGSIAANTVYLYRTQDGGMSWQPQSLPLASFPTPITQPPVFFSAIEGLLPVIVSTAWGPGFAVYSTHDGGATWNGPTPPVSATGNAWIWDFLTMQQGWVVGSGGSTLNKTSDGGQHWTAITPGAIFQHISQLNFVSAQEGWAINTASPDTPILLKTMDGGRTWAQVSPIPLPFRVISVDLTVNPASIAGRSCGSEANFRYLATFQIPAGASGGTIHFNYTLNNGRSQTAASVTVGAGQTSATFPFTSSGMLSTDHTYPGIAQVMVTNPNIVFSPQVKPAGVCVAPGAFQVGSVSMSVNPISVAGLSCGTSLTATYTAIFHLAPGDPGGTIPFAYTVNNGRSSTQASLTVALGQTIASYTFVWLGNLPADHTFPDAGGVMVQSPNAIRLLLLGPSGMYNV